MRVENWNAKGVFDQLEDRALIGANAVMDDHVADAKRRCPIGTVTRPDGYVNRNVSFSVKGKGGKVREVNFIAKTWTGRVPGSLRDTIRKVTKHDRPGNLRCYAGNSKVFYARFVEYGTSRTKAHPFLRPSFQTIKRNAQSRIEAEMRKVPEVKA